MDIPGIQPFQPFGGQAHRLEREEKRSGVVQSGNAAGQRSAPEEERFVFCVRILLFFPGAGMDQQGTT